MIFVIVIFVVILFIVWWKPFGRGPTRKQKKIYSYRNSLFYKGQFHNNPPMKILNHIPNRKGKRMIPQGEIPVQHLDSIPHPLQHEFNWIWLGHSSSILQLDGKNILIDPVWSDYASPIQGLGPRRFSKIPIDIEKMPMIDILVVSHDHYDHLDYHTIVKIDEKVKVYCVPLGVENHLIRWGVDSKKMKKMGWWDEVTIDKLTIIATPSRHYTGRVPWNKNRSLWCGYIFKNNKYQVFYTGDTGYGHHFVEIYERYGEMDFVILECGQYNDAWREIHMLPVQSIQAIKDLHATCFVPVHWGTFALAYHDWDEPINWIKKLSEVNHLCVITPMIGEMMYYDRVEQYQKSWWKHI